MAYDDFGVSLQFYDGQMCEKHGHQDIEITYVLEGTIKIGVGADTYLLKKDDVLVINANYIHEWVKQGDALVCVIRVKMDMITKELGTDYVAFWCNSVADKNTDYRDIRQVISDLMAEYSVNMDMLTFKKKALFYQLLDILLNHYMIENKSKMDILTDDDMFQRVLKFIQDNYWRQLSLGEMAAQVYMTDSTFSRYFKKNAGINFLEYLNNLRLQNALADLLYSDKPLTRIALDHGFTNPSMFSKAFKAAYDMSPSAYKKIKKSSVQDAYEAQNTLEPQIDYKEGLQKYVREKKNQTLTDVFKRQVTADGSMFRPYKKVWNQAVNVGAASELLSAKMQQHLLALKDALGFKYVRIVNIFSWDMRIRKDRESKYLNFELVDNVLDFIVSNQMYPIIEFGDKPRRVLQNMNALIYTEDEEPIFQSMEESRFVIEKFAAHIVQRYGSSEVEQWLFDNWHDERANRRGGGYHYLDVFDSVYNVIKAWAPQAAVGGYGMELGAEDMDILKQWQHRPCRPSFISVSAFPYKRMLPGFDIKEHGASHTTDIHFLRNEVHKLRKLLKEYGLGDIPVMLTEWNLSLSDRNYYNDSCGKAAQMLMNMTELLEEVDMGAYLFASDLTVRYYDTTKMFFGGTGLLSKDGLSKPAYYALYFMQRLGSYIVESGDGYIVTTDGKGSYYILMFNYKNFNYNYYTKDEDQMTIDDLPNIYTDTDSVEVQLELNHIKEGNYLVKIYTVGIGTGSALHEWHQLGANLELDMSDQEYLKRISIPHITIRRQSSDNGLLVITEVLKAQDIKYIHIYK